MTEKQVGKYTRTYKLPVTTRVAQLAAETPNRVCIFIYNNGSATVYLLSQQKQTAIDGIPIPAAASYNNDTCYGEYWIIAASGTQDIRVEEDAE